MTYEKWMTLSEEEQTQTPEEELPEIPKEYLSNGLTKSVAEYKDGQLGWRVTQGTFEEWFPVYRMRLIQGREFWYKLDPTSGLYSLNLTGVEPSMEEEPIGRYGMAWIDFMKRDHEDIMLDLQLSHKFLTVARSVDRRAWEYREILERDYEKMYPRTQTGFEENLKYNRTMEYYVDSTVMREVVLIPVTEP